MTRERLLAGLPARQRRFQCYALLDRERTRAASTRLGRPLCVVDEAAHVPHLEQPASFVDRLTALPTAAPLSAQEAVG